jgi:hypothetical protein
VKQYGEKKGTSYFHAKINKDPGWGAKMHVGPKKRKRLVRAKRGNPHPVKGGYR